ncbi:MAG TPA: hypothetical protein VEK08_19300 [Planctomycetota bacterium]|nr:hypothetical protein [Planctomycetota bacterium]
MSRFLYGCALAALLLTGTGCGPAALARRQAPPPGKHLTVAPAQTPDLSDREYLMRKATLGSRAERLEALDVIERAGDPAMFGFLMERLTKEDDRFIQIRVMHALASYGDVRAIPPLRSYARWDQTRVGVEATVALYELGDDTFVPRLIAKLRLDEENPELAGISHRALKKMTGANIGPNPRAWLNYWRAHRLAPYQSRAWFWPFRAPLPPTVEGSTIVASRPPKGKVPLPDRDVRLRHTNVTWYDWWKPDEP